MSTLAVEHLVKDFPLYGRGRSGKVFRAVDDVSFTLHAGQTTALVGESGSGKSTIARILARLEQPTSGRIVLNGEPVKNDRRSVRAYRGKVQMVFQDPFASLNPVKTIRHHLIRALRIHGVCRTKEQEREEVYNLLERVNLRPADRIAAKYPHELSGGQRQRVAIARALAPRPRVLLADEPVSMLDVSIRLDILNLIDRLKREENLAVLYITHDLATARHFSTSIMVMYRGQIVERGAADDVIINPRHPYTQLLAGAAPDPWAPQSGGVRGLRKAARSGAQTDPLQEGCLFADRCPDVMPICRSTRPLPVRLGAEHEALCWLHAEQPAGTGFGR